MQPRSFGPRKAGTPVAILNKARGTWIASFVVRTTGESQNTEHVQVVSSGHPTEAAALRAASNWGTGDARR